MQDFDKFASNFERLSESMAGAPTEEIGGLAAQRTMAEISSRQIQPGLGAVADSLTRIGGGGGFYAGAAADPQLEQQKRMVDLLAQIHDFITEQGKIDVPVGN
jgi:hypothetical protein